MIPLAELLPDEDFRLHLTLRRGRPEDFFRPLDPTGAVRRERARWLAEDPDRYARVLPAGEALIREFAEQWPAAKAAWPEPAAEPKLRADLWRLGTGCEADLLFLAPDAAGDFRLAAGVLCFPTGWALEEKIGETIDFIHAPVPGLNAALGSPIRSFLGKMRPGLAFLRDNWGIAATEELNLHPARQLPAPARPVGLDRLWLRVEHQMLAALPSGAGIVFAIRIANYRLDDVVRGGGGPGLKRALATMPADLAAYKRLESVRAELLYLL